MARFWSVSNGPAGATRLSRHRIAKVCVAPARAGLAGKDTLGIPVHVDCTPLRCDADNLVDRRTASSGSMTPTGTWYGRVSSGPPTTITPGPPLWMRVASTSEA
jgi:hypothetical protein